MTRSRQTADWGSRAGLAKIVPSSVAVGSGTGSSDTTGKVTFSGASTVSLNGVFTSSYRNYKIIVSNDFTHIITELIEYKKYLMYHCKLCSRHFYSNDSRNKHYQYFHKNYKIYQI
jgi:hypothetical protein